MKKATPAGWRTTKKERTAYGLYFLGQNMIYTFPFMFLTTYLLMSGISPVKTAGILVLLKVWDAVNDALFGGLIDGIHFKKGKFLPWLRISLPVILLATLALFHIPGSFSENGKLIWFAAAYLIWDTSYTLCDVPIYSAITSMTRNIEERNTMLSYKSIWAGVGIAFITVAGTVLPGEHVGLSWSWVAVITAVFAIITMMPINRTLKERHAGDQDESFTLRRMFSYLFKNKYLLIYYLGVFFYSALNIGNAFTIYVSYYLFNSALFSLLVGAIGIVPQLLIAFLLPKLIRRYDKMKVNRICLLAYVILSVITWALGYGNVALYIVMFTIRSVPLAVVALEMFMFTPDCAEYGRFKSGTDAKGITFAMQTFMAKLTGSISGSLGMIILGLKSVGWKVVEVSSFQELAESGVTQTPHALKMLWLIFMLVPAIGGLLAYIVWCFYDLKDKDVQIMTDCNTGKITREEAMSMLSKRYDIKE